MSELTNMTTDALRKQLEALRAEFASICTEMMRGALKPGDLRDANRAAEKILLVQAVIAQREAVCEHDWLATVLPDGYILERRCARCGAYEKWNA